jgi:Abortive infection alpha
VVDPIVTPLVIAGAGTWFANKLLGPSADGLGDQLKMFASNRLEKIFKRTEELSGNAPLNPLQPGFAYLAISKASFSEDAGNITDMWANLLLAASKEQSSTYVNFAEILAQIGSQEAEILNSMVPTGHDFGSPVRVVVNLKSSIREMLNFKYRAVCPQEATSSESLQAEAREKLSALLNEDLGWPGGITTADYPYSNITNEQAGKITGGRQGVTISHDILIRQRLLEPFAFDLNQSFSSPYVEGVLVSVLGVEFVLTCRGEL